MLLIFLKNLKAENQSNLATVLRSFKRIGDDPIERLLIDMANVKRLNNLPGLADTLSNKGPFSFNHNRGDNKGL